MSKSDQCNRPVSDLELVHGLVLVRCVCPDHRESLLLVHVHHLGEVQNKLHSALKFVEDLRHKLRGVSSVRRNTSASSGEDRFPLAGVPTSGPEVCDYLINFHNPLESGIWHIQGHTFHLDTAKAWGSSQ